MKLKEFSPIYSIWEQVETIYSTYEAEGLKITDLDHEIDTAVTQIPKLTDSEVLKEISEALNVEVKILQTLRQLKIATLIDLRRILACRELSLNAGLNYPVTVKYQVVAKRYGFSPETVRRFYTRYPHYFKCDSITKYFPNT